MYVVLSKRRCMLLCVAVLIIGIAAGGIGRMIPGARTFGYGSGKTLKVIVDAGHGIPDGGATGANGTVESDVNLEISEKIAEVLTGKGIDTVMTRTGSEGIRKKGEKGWSKVEDMRQRMQIMKKSDADLFVSVHMNHFPQSQVHGLRVFYAGNHEEIKPLAEEMQEQMSVITGAKTSAVRAADKNLFLMKSPPMPAVLVECGFLSNPQEEKNLSDEEYQAKLAWAIAEAIENHFMNE